MKKTFKKSLGVCFIAFGLGGGTLGTAIAQESAEDFYFNTPFEACFKSGYDFSDLSVEQTFGTAECLSSLLASDAALNPGASQHTIMQYAAVWYGAAAEKGHPLSLTKQASNLIAMNELESQMRTTVLIDVQQMLSSEALFHSLDQDSNGKLTIDEMDEGGELKTMFAKSDFDRDGSLSIVEYTIVAGEATAAGY